MHESEASAFTLFHQRVSRTAELSFLCTQPLRANSGSAERTIVKTCSSSSLFRAKWRFNYYGGPDRTLDSHSTKEDIPELQVTRYMSRLSTYLNHTHAGVQEDGSFGLFGDLLIFVEVQVIGAVPELGQVEISPLKGLGQKCTYGIWKEKSIKTFMFHFYPPLHQINVFITLKYPFIILFSKISTL